MIASRKLHRSSNVTRRSAVHYCVTTIDLATCVIIPVFDCYCLGMKVSFTRMHIGCLILLCKQCVIRVIYKTFFQFGIGEILFCERLIDCMECDLNRRLSWQRFPENDLMIVLGIRCVELMRLILNDSTERKRTEEHILVGVLALVYNIAILAIRILDIGVVVRVVCAIRGHFRIFDRKQPLREEYVSLIVIAIVSNWG